jgi:hypothetical protein
VITNESSTAEIESPLQLMRQERRYPWDPPYKTQRAIRLRRAACRKFLSGEEASEERRIERIKQLTALTFMQPAPKPVVGQSANALTSKVTKVHEGNPEK